jgi:hypothetical protein
MRSEKTKELERERENFKRNDLKQDACTTVLHVRMYVEVNSSEHIIKINSEREKIVFSFYFAQGHCENVNSE